jgi:phosphoglycolate phosphatase-like HAD superfamily hydrolase
MFSFTPGTSGSFAAPSPFIAPIVFPTGVGTNAFTGTGAFGRASSLKPTEISNDYSLCAEKKLIKPIKLCVKNSEFGSVNEEVKEFYDSPITYFYCEPLVESDNKDLLKIKKTLFEKTGSTISQYFAWIEIMIHDNETDLTFNVKCSDNDEDICELLCKYLMGIIIKDRSLYLYLKAYISLYRTPFYVNFDFANRTTTGIAEAPHRDRTNYIILTLFKEPDPQSYNLSTSIGLSNRISMTSDVPLNEVDRPIAIQLERIFKPETPPVLFKFSIDSDKDHLILIKDDLCTHKAPTTGRIRQMMRFKYGVDRKKWGDYTTVPGESFTFTLKVSKRDIASNYIQKSISIVQPDEADGIYTFNRTVLECKNIDGQVVFGGGSSQKRVVFVDNSIDNWTDDMDYYYKTVDFVRIPNAYQDTEKQYTKRLAKQGNRYASALLKYKINNFINKGIDAKIANQLKKWSNVKSKKPKHALFDWDGTISATEGFSLEAIMPKRFTSPMMDFLLPIFRKGGTRRNQRTKRKPQTEKRASPKYHPPTLNEMLDSPEYKKSMSQPLVIPAKDFLDDMFVYTMKPERVDILRDLFRTLRDNGVQIHILTHNPYASVKNPYRRIFIEMMWRLFNEDTERSSKFENEYEYSMQYKDRSSGNMMEIYSSSSQFISVISREELDEMLHSTIDYADADELFIKRVVVRKLGIV